MLDLLEVDHPNIIAVVGDPGSGRSHLVSALAERMSGQLVEPQGAFGDGSPASLWVQTLHREAPVAATILLDGVGVLGADPGDAVAQIIAAARDNRRWILLLTPADMRRFEIEAPEFANHLETVTLAPLEPDHLFQVVEAGLHLLVEGPDGPAPGRQRQDAHTAAITALSRVLLRLSPRYPSDRAQPGRALSLARLSTSRAQRLRRENLTEQEIAEVVGDAANLPVERLLRTEDERFQGLEHRLEEKVVGHQDARSKISDVLRRSYAGFRGRRPLASFLLLGPTGVGKTQAAKAIADALFDGDNALLRLDLSEFNERHSVNRLIGSPPGYVGHEQGGQLTEAIRQRPATVVLLDELEKAHREVLLTLLQVLEDGRLTDGRGRTVDFSSAVIVMTSNLGSELYSRTRKPATSTVTALARSRLPDELYNRIDEVLCFAPLAERELKEVVRRLALISSQRLENERGMRFDVDDTVLEQVLTQEKDRSLGARPLRRAFERLVEVPIANEILAGRVQPGTHLHISCDARGKSKLGIRSDLGRPMTGGRANRP